MLEIRRNKMKIYDNVILNTELKELSEIGVLKGCPGVIFDIKVDMCFVYFINRKNIGDYACVYVNKKYLDKLGHEPEDRIATWEQFKKSDKIKKNRCKPQKFLEYDLVELAVEKEKYAKEGVHKGARGCVMEDYCIGSEYLVVFEDGDIGEEIADIPVHEDDLILIRR